MGLYDEIRWDAALPAEHPPDNRLFQTKSLDTCCLDHYVVTGAGRLLLVGSGFEDTASAGDETCQGIDVEFHGDIRLVSVVGDIEYLARFTHGTLEWVRPLDSGEPWTTVAAAHMKRASARRLDG